MLKVAQALLVGNKSSVAVNAINGFVEQLLSVKSIQYDPTRRYVATVRDLGELAHIGGALFFGAFLILNADL